MSPKVPVLLNTLQHANPSTRTTKAHIPRDTPQATSMGSADSRMRRYSMVVPFQENWTDEALEAGFTMQSKLPQHFLSWDFLPEPYSKGRPSSQLCRTCKELISTQPATRHEMHTGGGQYSRSVIHNSCMKILLTRTLQVVLLIAPARCNRPRPSPLPPCGAHAILRLHVLQERACD